MRQSMQRQVLSLLGRVGYNGWAFRYVPDTSSANQQQLFGDTRRGVVNELTQQH